MTPQLLDVHKMLSGMSTPKLTTLPPFLTSNPKFQIRAELTGNRAPRRESTSSTHVGRGGAANVFKPSADEIEKAKRDNAKWESAVGDDESLKHGVPKPKGLADKGKDWLLGRK